MPITKHPAAQGNLFGAPSKGFESPAL